MSAWFKQIGRIVAAAAVLGALAACAGPRYSVVQNTLPPLAAGEGRIFFYQPQPSNISGPQQKLRVNNEVVGRNKPAAFFYVDRPAGSYVVTNLYWTGDGVSFALDEGQSRYVRITAENLGSTGTVGKLTMQLAEPEQAQAEMQPLRLWGAATPGRP
ncbi:hypothetical protein CEG14_08720 [Bordetella genomosp. 1]|uniref:DUF2846 domain-containing protein n=1 Tax=Bordetella genomosp. 1 TaxID=1395607 RepID=A0A261SDP4_9BORD|nr:hypothetical protein [Bordetella genomosp. 1]MDQ8031677.1 hypothetical protein [Bordetella sp.]OZI35181.1 hypothetical protein CEG14_08720 [Bordetella genomosp. 1]OZI63722.1 hypothetical protein CAL27_14025 [Bordetella genomosp. 1]